MFQSSSRIDSRLTREVEQAERIPGYQVLSAKLFWTPVLNMEVECEVLRPRKITLLEEFVLRAAIEFNNTPVSWGELSELLGVDKRFVKRTVDDLTQLARALKPSSDLLIATEVGEEFYTKGQVPQPPQIITVNLACVLPLTDLVMIPSRYKTKAKVDVEDVARLPGVGDIEDTIIRQILQNSDAQAVIEATARTGHPIHDPGEGNILQEVLNANFQGEDKTYWAILVVRDVLDNHIFVQVRNWGNSTITPLLISQMESWLNGMLDQGVIQLRELIQMEQSELDDLMRITSELVEDVTTDEESRAPAVERLVQSEILEIRANTASEILEVKRKIGTAELVRDSDIRPSFLDALEQARKRVLIVSPWVTEQAVDETLVNLFSKLAEKRVITVLGWGIAKRIEEENKPPTSSLLNKLSKIVTPEGLPAVSVVWLGNQHSKDVLIDDRMHLCGSHNWLSYRGDFQPRGESVYRVTIPEQVQRAAGIVEKLFLKRVDEEWNNRLHLPDNQVEEMMLLPLISTWIGVGRFDVAVQRAVEVVASHNCLTLLSVLTSAASERLFGADPNTRVGLLQSIGTVWGDVNVTKAHIGHPKYNQLAKNLRYLMERLVRQDEAGLREVIDLYAQIWRNMGVLEIEETTDSFVQTAIAQSSQSDSNAKDRHKASKKRKNK
jgi:hypothetical protein